VKVATYLLAWNPKRFQWDALAEESSALKAGQSVRDFGWSCGNSRRLNAGDRVFLIRLGKEPKGIFAAGTITRGSYENLHWDEDRAAVGETAYYIKVQLDTLLNPESDPILRRERLNDPALAGMHWDTQMSGVRIPDHIATELERVWAAFAIIHDHRLPEEVDDMADIYEGAVRRISVNAYERSAEARQKCLAHWGTSCSVCGFDFATTYGEAGRGFIHVHHLRELAGVGQEYQVDPIRDLRPVCPNCHAVIHRRRPAYTVEEVQQLMCQRRTDPLAAFSTSSRMEVE